MLRALLTAAVAATAAVPMLLPPEPAGPATVTSDAPHVRIEIRAYDAAGRRVAFDGVVTVVNATTTGMLPVHIDARTSWLDLPLERLAVPMSVVR